MMRSWRQRAVVVGSVAVGLGAVASGIVHFAARETAAAFVDAGALWVAVAVVMFTGPPKSDDPKE